MNNLFDLKYLISNYISEYNLNIIQFTFSLLLLYFSITANIKTLRFKLIPIYGFLLILSILILEGRIMNVIDLKGKSGVPLFTFITFIAIIFSISAIIVYIIRKNKDRK